MSTIESVLSTEEGKKILQELPIADPAAAPGTAAIPAQPDGAGVLPDTPPIEGIPGESILKGADVFLDSTAMSPKLDLEGVLNDTDAPHLFEDLDESANDILPVSISLSSIKAKFFISGRSAERSWSCRLRSIYEERWTGITRRVTT